MPVDREAAERAVAELLRALGFDPKRADLAGTPARVVEAFAQDLLRGHQIDIPRLIEEGACDAPSGASDGPVAITEIAVVSMCPHHLLPALGTANVVYLPGSMLLGIGTVAALVDAFARRLTLQEEIAKNVVTALVDGAGARAAYCELSLAHGCLRARGEQQMNAFVRSSARAGLYASPQATPEIALALGRNAL
ncbi:MAG TPA: GTP cyclohydrolase I [Polyangiaceae bacterium]|jgi:GTP cyclohydrolase I